MKYSHFENLTRRGGRTSSPAPCPRSRSARSWTSPTWTRRAFDGADSGRRQCRPTTRSFSPSSTSYGYTANGVKIGGGTVGFGQQFDDDNFFRDSGQVGYNLTLGENVTHEHPRGLPVVTRIERT